MHNISRKMGVTMDWKYVLAVSLLFAKPVFKGVQAFVVDRTGKRQYHHAVGSSGLSTAELDDIYWKSDADILAFLKEKGLNERQIEAALQYVDKHRYVEGKCYEGKQEIERIKGWAEKAKSEK